MLLPVVNLSEEERRLKDVKLSHLIEDRFIGHVGEDCVVFEALKKAAQEGLRVLLIRGKRGPEIRGVVTLRSLLAAMVKGDEPLKETLRLPVTAAKVKAHKVKVYTTDTLLSLLGHIKRRWLGAVPLYSTNNEIVGILTYRKLYEYLGRTIDLTSLIASLSSRKYPELMVAPNTMVKTVIRKFVKYRQGPIIIHRRGKVLGVVTPLNLLKALTDTDTMEKIEEGIDEYFLNAPITTFASKDYPRFSLERLDMGKADEALRSHEFFLTVSADRLTGLVTVMAVITEYARGLNV